MGLYNGVQSNHVSKIVLFICSILCLLRPVVSNAEDQYYVAPFKWVTNITYYDVLHPQYFETPREACQFQADWREVGEYNPVIVRPYGYLNYERTYGHYCQGIKNETRYSIGRTWLTEVCPTGSGPFNSVDMGVLRRVCRISSCGGFVDPITGECSDYLIGSNSGKRCPETGNPVTIGIGNKYQEEVDYSNASGLVFKRTFNSVWANTSPDLSWRHNYSMRIVILPNGGDGRVAVWRPDGEIRQFSYDSTSNLWMVEDGSGSKLEELKLPDGTISGWRYFSTHGIVEDYDIDGLLIKITLLNGIQQTLTYSDRLSKGYFLDDSLVETTNLLPSGYLIKVEDDLGRAIQLGYDNSHRIVLLTTPDGTHYKYKYANNSLVGVILPDNTPADDSDNPQRIYHYDDADFPQALTGITDENGVRYATWSYDDEGRAISSEHANGVDKTTLTYNADGSTTVTNPLGKQTTYHFVTIEGVKKVTQVEGHPTASCEGANRVYSYDVNGNVISKTDWNGVTTTYTYDLNRNLELTRTEASGTPQARIITTQWHPQFRLPTKVTEPNKITEYTYDAQGRQLSSKVSSVQ